MFRDFGTGVKVSRLSWISSNAFVRLDFSLSTVSHGFIVLGLSTVAEDISEFWYVRIHPGDVILWWYFYLLRRLSLLRIHSSSDTALTSVSKHRTLSPAISQWHSSIFRDVVSLMYLSVLPWCLIRFRARVSQVPGPFWTRSSSMFNRFPVF